MNGALVLESSVVHPVLEYCGIVDCVARLGDTVVLVDWKTSERVKNSVQSLYDNPIQVMMVVNYGIIVMVLMSGCCIHGGN